MTKLFPNITVIGLTGKIGSGKSEFAKFLSEQGGFRYIDCDKIVQDIYQHGKSGAKKIRTFFGDQYILKNGTVNRKKLLKTLFKSPKKWEILNRMIHPLVAEELNRRLRKIKSGTVILEIQIYNERLFQEYIDEVWFIETKESLRTRRLKKRNLTQEQIVAISTQQPEPPQKNRIITNNKCRNKLKQTTRKVLKEFS